MLKRNNVLLFFVLLMHSSCIEIIDDLLIKNDGSGTLKYTLNLSSSKVKINSILALDTFNNQRVLKKEEIKNKIEIFKQVLKSKPGISKVELNEDFEEYIFKFSCNFTDAYCLQDALYSAYDSLQSGQRNTRKFEWIQWNNKTLTRSIPDIDIFKNIKIKEEDNEQLKNGYYTSITRFDGEIQGISNNSAKISKSKKACLLKVDMHSFKSNRKLLETKITL
jgi:hypothetical protein